MSWIRIDDGFPQHPKVVGLSDAAFRAWVEGVCYASRYLTDGLLPASAIGRVVPAGAIDELVEAGLWIERADGLEIHDYTDYQQSRADVVEKRQRQAEGRRRGFRAVSRGAGGRFASDDENAQVGPLDTASSGESGTAQAVNLAPLKRTVKRTVKRSADDRYTSPKHRPEPTRSRTEGSRSSTSSQDLDLQGAGPSEEPDPGPGPGEADPAELSEDLERALGTDDQRYLLARVVGRAPRFADLLPAHVLKLRKDHGDAAVTAALQRLAEFDRIASVKRPGRYLEVALDEVAGEIVAVGEDAGP